MNRSETNVDISVNNRGLLDEQCSWYVSLAVVTIGCAIGFVKANLGPFGADQVKPQTNLLNSKFFFGQLIWFNYRSKVEDNKWCLNISIGFIGALIWALFFAFQCWHFCSKTTAFFTDSSFPGLCWRLVLSYFWVVAAVMWSRTRTCRFFPTYSKS